MLFAARANIQPRSFIADCIDIHARSDRDNVVDLDLGSAKFPPNAQRHMAELVRRPQPYVLAKGSPPQVVVGR